MKINTMKNRLFILTDCGHVEVFLNNANPIQINHSIDKYTAFADGTNNGGLRTYYSTTIEIPMNGVNCKALSIAPDTAIQQVRELLSTSPDVRLERGIITYSGFLVWFGSKKENGVTTIEATFTGSSRSFFSALPKYLCDLPAFGCHPFSTSFLNANFQNVGAWDGNTSPLYYSLKNWGNLTGDFVPLSQMRPDIHIAAIWKQIEIYTGFRIVSRFFKTEFFRNLLLGSYQFKTDEKPPLEILSGVLNADYLPQAVGPFPFIIPVGDQDWTLNDPYSLHDNNNASIRMVSSSARVNVTVKIHAITDDGAGTNTNIFWIRTGTQGAILDTFTTNGGGVYDFELTTTIPSEGLFSLAWSGQGIIKAGTTFSVCVTGNDAPVEFQDICANDFLGGKLKTIDLITACVEKYNLRIMSNSKDDTIIIEPAYDYYIPVTGERGQGFYRNELTDLKGKIDCSKSEFDFTVEDVGRNLIYRFQNDSKDQTADEDTFADTRVLATKFKNDETEVKNSFFAATTDDVLPSLPAININEIVVPTFRNYDINDPDHEPNNVYDIKPRIFYKVGSTDGAWNFGTNRNGFVALPQYPKVTQQDTALNINLGYADADGVPGLVSIFRSKDIQILNSGMVRRFDILLKPTELMCMEDLLRQLAWVNVKGAQGRHIVQSINWELGSPVASVELITFDI
jgi:hypothetical protein